VASSAISGSRHRLPAASSLVLDTVIQFAPRQVLIAIVDLETVQDPCAPAPGAPVDAQSR
jgi:hypothetical protein